MIEMSLNVDSLVKKKFKTQKFTVEKVNGEYVFTSTKKKNKTLGSSATIGYKIERKVRNKIQKTSRKLNR